MKIQVLGTRGEIKLSALKHSHHSGVILDNKLLLDFGETKYLENNLQLILITHLHPDHAAFVRERETKISNEIEIIAPEKYKGFKISVKTKPFYFEKYKVTPIPTLHSKKVRSQAYRIDHDGRSILYTGDLIWIKKEYRHLLKNLDLVITDGSYIKAGGLVRQDPATKESFGHTGIPNLIKLFSKYSPKILVVHFGSWFFKNIERSHQQISELGKKYEVETLAGYDGMKLEI